MKVSSLFCSRTATLFECLKIINSGGVGAALLVDDELKMIGLITDGEVRRALIAGASLNENVELYANKNFEFGKVEDTPANLAARFDNRVKLLPVLDSNGRVCELLQWDTKMRLPVAEPDLRGNELKYLLDAFLSTWISSTGEYLARFESGFSKFCGSSFGVSTCNGTAALQLALSALDIGPGDEVIVPDLTFGATINSVLAVGATPVIVDVDPITWCISPDHIEDAISTKTRAVIPVHLFGQPCDMNSVMRIAKAHNLRVIEDAAEAHGATYHGRSVGSFGDVAAFSFFANKIITTGEGGMCVTSSPELDEKMRILRDHGMNRSRRYWHDCAGFNYRMTNLQAAIGVAQLERVRETIDLKRQIENSYRDGIGDLENVHFQVDVPETSRVVWLASICVSDGRRDEHLENLLKVGIDSRPFFYSLGSMPIFREFSHSNSNSLRISRAGISLPSSRPVTAEVLEKIRDVLSGS